MWPLSFIKGSYTDLSDVSVEVHGFANSIRQESYSSIRSSVQAIAAKNNYRYNVSFPASSLSSSYASTLVAGTSPSLASKGLSVIDSMDEAAIDHLPFGLPFKKDAQSLEKALSGMAQEIQQAMNEQVDRLLYIRAVGATLRYHSPHQPLEKFLMRRSIVQYIHHYASLEDQIVLRGLDVSVPLLMKKYRIGKFVSKKSPLSTSWTPESPATLSLRRFLGGS